MAPILLLIFGMHPMTAVGADRPARRWRTASSSTPQLVNIERFEFADHIFDRRMLSRRLH
jgi:hypothetical protein